MNWARRVERRLRSLRYHRQTCHIMARVLDRASNCVAVGAGRGSLLAEVMRLAPEGRHFGYEPLPDLAAGLARRFPGLSVEQVAVSDASGERPFYHVVNRPEYSGLQRLGSIPARLTVHQLRVRTEPLDDLLPADVPISLLSIEVEGAQLQVLRGAEYTVQRWKPVIVFEYGTSARLGYGTTPTMIWSLVVERYGLRISRLGDWLARRPPLTLTEFEASVGFQPGSEFRFLAHL
ncbi:MAG: FkbM family methyltransferase [Gemmatimonadales bacterium]